MVYCYEQDQQDIQLEDERDKLLTKRAILIQKVVRGFLIRQRYTKMKSGSVLIQKTWRGYQERQKYSKVSYNTTCRGTLVFSHPVNWEGFGIRIRCLDLLKFNLRDICWLQPKSDQCNFFPGLLNIYLFDMTSLTSLFRPTILCIMFTSAIKQQTKCDKFLADPLWTGTTSGHLQSSCFGPKIPNITRANESFPGILPRIPCTTGV